MDLTGLMAEPLIVTSIPNFVRDFNFIERTFIDPIHLTIERLILEVHFAAKFLLISYKLFCIEGQTSEFTLWFQQFGIQAENYFQLKTRL